jgi:hypothetical protein
MQKQASSMTLTPDQERAVLEMVASELAQTAAPQLAELQLLTIREAAALLHCSETRARTLLGNYVDLGERLTRVPLSAVKQLIEDRTVRNP